jgi:hypothetical protein
MAFELINALIPADDEDLHVSIATGASEYAIGNVLEEGLPIRLMPQLDFREYVTRIWCDHFIKDRERIMLWLHIPVELGRQISTSDRYLASACLMLSHVWVTEVRMMVARQHIIGTKILEFLWFADLR